MTGHRMGGEEECRSAFAMFDTDCSGTIDEKELFALATQLGATLTDADVRARDLAKEALLRLKSKAV